MSFHLNEFPSREPQSHFSFPVFFLLFVIRFDTLFLSSSKRSFYWDCTTPSLHTFVHRLPTISLVSTSRKVCNYIFIALFYSFDLLVPWRSLPLLRSHFSPLSHLILPCLPVTFLLYYSVSHSLPHISTPSLFMYNDALTLPMWDPFDNNQLALVIIRSLLLSIVPIVKCLRTPIQIINSSWIVVNLGPVYVLFQSPIEYILSKEKKEEVTLGRLSFSIL